MLLSIWHTLSFVPLTKKGEREREKEEDIVHIECRKRLIDSSK